MGKPWRVAEGMEGCMEKRAESVEGCGGLWRVGTKSGSCTIQDHSVHEQGLGSKGERANGATGERSARVSLSERGIYLASEIEKNRQHVTRPCP